MITLEHGSWSPDLQNNAVEVTPGQPEVEAPSADCLNVYYQDGGYRCLPGINPYAYALGVLLSSTLTAGSVGGAGGVVGFDSGVIGLMANAVDVNGNAILSLTQSSGRLTLAIVGPTLGASYFSTLAIGNGVTAPSILQSSAATYHGIGGINAWEWTNTAPFTPGGVYAVIMNQFSTVSILNAHTWYDTVAGKELLFAATPDGLYTLTDGLWAQISTQIALGVQGTGVSAAFRLLSNAQGFGVSGTFALGAGTASGQIIYSGSMLADIQSGIAGYVASTYGSIDPSFDANGYGIITLTSDGSHLALQLNVGFDPGADYFAQLLINGATQFNSSDAVYSANGGLPIWRWTTPFNFAAGSTYAVQYS